MFWKDSICFVLSEAEGQHRWSAWKSDRTDSNFSTSLKRLTVDSLVFQGQTCHDFFLPPFSYHFPEALLHNAQLLGTEKICIFALANEKWGNRKDCERKMWSSNWQSVLWRKLSVKELMRLNCGVGEDSWESLGLQGDPINPFWRDQPWDFFGRNDAKAETPVLWPPHVKSWLIGKDSDAGKDWGQEEKGTTEDEMAGWHHRLDGRESEWTPGVGDGQGGLACCDSWGHK